MADAKVWHSSRNGARSTLVHIFINDLPKHLEADCSIFADDTTVFASGTDRYTTCAGLSEDLSSASRWTMTWGMFFNAEKSEHLAISNGNKEQLSSLISALLKMVDAELPVVELHRHLGVIIKKAMTWGDHIDEVFTSCARKLGMLNRLMCIFDKDSIRRIHVSVIKPSMEYACAIWSGGQNWNGCKRSFVVDTELPSPP